MEYSLIDLRNKLLDLLPMIDLSRNNNYFIFYCSYVEHNNKYTYITKCGYYNLIKKLMYRIIELINNDRGVLDKDFENDIFPQLIKELRKEKLEKILRR